MNQNGLLLSYYFYVLIILKFVRRLLGMNVFALNLSKRLNFVRI